MGTGTLLLLIAGIFAASGNGNGKKNGKKNGQSFGEPDTKPGPIDRPKKLEPDEADFEDEDDPFIALLDELIREVPTAGRFYQVRKGDTMANIARAVLKANSTGSNRIAYIKCCTRVPWNDALYVSDRHPSSWGTLFDVDGRNLSAAFLPRNAKATQAMMERKLPPRTIGASGQYIGGQTGYQGLLWLPPVTASEAYGVSCNPTNPPAQLMDQLS